MSPRRQCCLSSTGRKMHKYSHAPPPGHCHSGCLTLPYASIRIHFRPFIASEHVLYQQKRQVLQRQLLPSSGKIDE